MTRKAALGEFEQLVLLAVLGLESSATGARISRRLEKRAGREISRGALYSALERLEGKRFLTWRVDAATPERGGHASRVFSLTEAGLDALREQQQALRRLADGLEEALGLEGA